MAHLPALEAVAAVVVVVDGIAGGGDGKAGLLYELDLGMLLFLRCVPELQAARVFVVVVVVVAVLD